MQSVALGRSDHDIQPKQESIDSPDRKPNYLQEAPAPPHVRNDSHEPPAKRRKIADADLTKLLPRPVSPPWKRSDAEGPTSFLEDGRRKSGRTNVVPLELQPQSSRRQTRAAFDRRVTDHYNQMKPSYNLVQKKPMANDLPKKKQEVPDRHTPVRTAKSRSLEPSTATKKQPSATPRTSPAATKIDELKKQLARLKKEKAKIKARRQSSPSPNIDSDDDVDAKSSSSVEELAGRTSLSGFALPSQPVFHKVTFRVHLPKPSIATPANLPPVRKYNSFDEFLLYDDTEPLLGYGHEFLTPEQIHREAVVRRRVRDAQRPGHLLSRKSLSLAVARQREPPRQFAHRDHLLAHVTHFRRLLRDEHRSHKKQAEVIAYEAKRYVEEKARRNKVKTKEEIEQEEYVRVHAIYRTVVKDVGRLWSAVLLEVGVMRQKEYEEQQQAKMKGHLARVLDRTDQMLNREAELDEVMTDVDEQSGDTSMNDDTDDSEQMSRSGSSSESESEAEDNDAEMTIEQLQAKYGNMPNIESTDVDTASRAQSSSDLDSAREHSESETEMDSELDGEESNSEEMDELQSDDDEGDYPGLTSLFTEQEITLMASAEATDREESVLDQGQSSLTRGPLFDDKTQVRIPTHENDMRSKVVDELDLLGETNPKSRRMADTIDTDLDGSDTSDEDIEMDSEFDTEYGESAEDTENEDPGTDGDEDEGDEGLLSLFSAKEKEELANAHTRKPAQLDATEAQFSASGIEDSGQDADLLLPSTAETREPVPEKPKLLTPQPVEPVHDPDSADHMRASSEQLSIDVSTQASPRTVATKASEPESMSSVELPKDTSSTEAKESRIQTPVPKLLRGTLRTYQHEGLDWLANLYVNGRSGILADEMGLGKTIQSIALLAHLAEVHEVWGPHLIVVPTSVMLNWEMEFKKFLPGFKILTYYGNQEERKQKRRGWMADDSFNVCITSYQLVLQDASSFKRRKWHYMVLDEAHNIKNFRSERWQTMMTFNTRARLLLTGTPLQNNLTELWSLLFFLHYGQETENDDDAFAGLKEWSEWFKRPVESILEHNRQTLDQEDKEQVAKLHKVIRPFLLRRLKADVEKQMPSKYEHIELCRLSKRQRQLYDGFMSRAQTKETLASGNYMSIINALMQLRKVCNHPDLFETRPINTSFAMPKSVAAEYEIRALLLQRMCSNDDRDLADLGFLQLVPIAKESKSMIEFQETSRRHAFNQIRAIRDCQLRRLRGGLKWHGHQRTSLISSLENIGRNSRLQELERTMYCEAYKHHEHPVYGRWLLEKLRIATTYNTLSQQTRVKVLTRFWEREGVLSSFDLVRSTQAISEYMEPYVRKFACLTPAVVANDFSRVAITEAGEVSIRHSHLVQGPDPFHQARMKLSIAFPDKRLLQYDCGKLQRLDRLLRRLQADGHRALIFTQMTKVLDILEQFLNIHGHLYLRLDGATKIEQRQLLTERFNSDPRILCFILSSRSGGLGINLTGADTVIFYDLDWNPAMDKQCTDRAHRIGQTRDVHIYRFVSEHTIESNILRKARQKQLLDDVVIQEGDFTTDYRNKLNYRDMLDANDEDDENDVAGAAMDRVLGNERSNVAAFEQVEDKEDIAAAKVAAKEVQNADDGDFDETVAQTPGESEAKSFGPDAVTNAALAEAGDSGNHIDEYMLRLQKWLLRDVPLGPPKDKTKRKRRKGDEHGVRRR